MFGIVYRTNTKCSKSVVFYVWLQVQEASWEEMYMQYSIINDPLLVIWRTAVFTPCIK